MTMTDRVDAVVIGGGITGCAVAYELSTRGQTVSLVERDWLCAGATGRCGAGIRQQWSTEENALLAKKSIEMFEHLTDELGHDIELRQGGYLIAVHDEADLAQAKKNIAMQQRIGLPVRLIDEAEIVDVAPLLDVRGMDAIAATFCPTDGHASPFHTTYAYALAARRNGADIRRFTTVTDIAVEDGSVTAVVTDTDTIKTDVVVNAAGCWSRDVAAMAGLQLPNRPLKKEALVTEPVAHLFDCMVISFRDGIYFSQQEHGQILGGIPLPEPVIGTDDASTYPFLRHMAATLGRYAPCLRHVNVLRQWAGYYDVTPDALPILGPSPVDGFIQCHGFSGHGFMIAPMTARLLAQLICGEPLDMPIDRLHLDRFRHMPAPGETSVVG
jgi:sarcosine oxidase subunit beta